MSCLFAISWLGTVNWLAAVGRVGWLQRVRWLKSVDQLLLFSQFFLFFKDCPPERKDGIEWPETEASMTAFMPCPSGIRGKQKHLATFVIYIATSDLWGQEVLKES